jgi:hypothetical protein
METWIALAIRGLLALQLSQATVAGVVRDHESGEAVAGATVLLTELGRTALTDAQGAYAFPAVPPGPQHLSVQRIGYAARTLHALVPRQGALQIDIVLRREPVVLPQVEVRRPPAVRAATASDQGAFPNRTLSIQDIRNHPLLAEPDAFLALSGGHVVLRPESPSGMHVHGGAADQVAYVLDGVPVFNPFHAGGVFSAWNPDALERVQLVSTPAAHAVDALSGALSATLRTPASDFAAQGSVSTSQARITVDGPLVRGGGFLLSVRSGFPTPAWSPRDASYLRGEIGDVLLKLELPAPGGRFLLLGYEGENEFSAAAAALDDGEPPTPVDMRRHSFNWLSKSVGAQWLAEVAGWSVQALGWSAYANAQAEWRPAATAPQALRAAREDLGVQALIERKRAATVTTLGASLRRSTTSYRVHQPAAAAPYVLAARAPATSLFVRHETALGRQFALQLTGSAIVAAGVHLSPMLELRWQRTPRLIVRGGLARAHQLTQSLRNPESLVSNIFPAELWMGASADSVPVARSNLVWLTGEYHPAPALRISGQVYARQLDGLLLVAPRTGEPFATGGFATGSGSASGFSMAAHTSGARYGVVASYGWQEVRFARADSGFVPEHGMQHTAEAGIILFPTSTFAARFGLTAAAGRRATSVDQAFEWEACNLLDRGCEFGGSPVYETDQLGRTRLPAYLRLDVGLRKHWHMHIARRNATVALFGTLTNVFRHDNILTVARDGATGQPVQVPMRPRAPLVVGIDWSF